MLTDTHHTSGDDYFCGVHDADQKKEGCVSLPSCPVCGDTHVAPAHAAADSQQVLEGGGGAETGRATS